jgi:hypothetical protein
MVHVLFHQRRTYSSVNWKHKLAPFRVVVKNLPSDMAFPACAFPQQANHLLEAGKTIDWPQRRLPTDI